LDIALKSLDKLAGLKPRILYFSHFGAAYDSVDRLKTYANQLKLWLRIVRQGIKDKQTFEKIRERIIESDKAVNKAAEFIKAHRILNETVFGNSLQGIIWFAQKRNNSPGQ
jgi:predicted ATP-binding protein involved in virulence